MFFEELLELLKAERLAFIQIELFEDELGVFLDHQVDFVGHVGGTRASVR